MPTVKLLLATGEMIEVAGSIEEVAKTLENATRSSAGALAWLQEGADEDAGTRVAVNPSHIVSIRPARE
jgi:hypothetical protein